MPKGSGPAASRVRARYAQQACDVCRAKKIKCDGVKHVCGPCNASNRKMECAWTKETVRKPRTEAHFEALRKHADALEAYLRVLEERLAKCSCQIVNDGQGHLQFRPEQIDEDSDEGAGSDEADITQELCVPTASLKLEDRDLMLHGITTPFRFATNPLTRAPTLHATSTSPNASYVLMLDGVDESQCDPTFPWSRYLPDDILFDRREHDRLLDLVFKYFTSWCMRIIPTLFLRDMHRYLTHPHPYPHKLKTAHYSPMLHNALLALGSAYSDDPRVRSVSARRAISAHAKSFIEAEVIRPDISVVHALAIVGSFHSSHGEMMLGWMYFGMSARISQALGLSIDTSPWVRSGLITHADMVDRNWTYWITFTQDVCWSLYVGRDLGTSAPPSSDHLRPRPGEKEWFEELDDIPFSYPAPPGGTKPPPQPNCLAKTGAATCELLLIATKIMGVINNLGRSATRHQVTDRVITDIDVQLHTWKSRLSPEVDITPLTRESSTPHRLMMHAAYWWCFILLHRPFFHRKARPAHGSDPEVDHVKLCKRAAENIMELLGAWKKLYGLKFSQVTLPQAAFSAGTVFLLLAVSSTSPTRARIAPTALRTSLAEVERCIQYLSEIGEVWQAGNLMAGILRSLLTEQVRPLVERKAGATRAAVEKDQVGSDHEAVTDSLPATSAPSESVEEQQLLNLHPSTNPNIPTDFSLYQDLDSNHLFANNTADANPYDPMAMSMSLGIPDFLAAMLGNHDHDEPLLEEAPYMAPMFGFGFGEMDLSMDFGMGFGWEGVGVGVGVGVTGTADELEGLSFGVNGVNGGGGFGIGDDGIGTGTGTGIDSGWADYLR